MIVFKCELIIACVKFVRYNLMLRFIAIFLIADYKQGIMQSVWVFKNHLSTKIHLFISSGKLVLALK
jgi:hypothetical protein